MASPLSGVGESLFRLGESRRQKQGDSIDALIKQAQLKEMGYQVQQKPGGFFGGGQTTITQDPNFVSTKALEREKLTTENALNQMKLKRFQGQGGFGSGGASNPNLVPKTYDEYGLPNSFYDANQDLEQKRKEKEQEYALEAQKPLGSNDAKNLTMSENALHNSEEIRKDFKFGKIGQDDYQRKVMALKLARFGAGGNPLLGMAGMANYVASKFAGDEGKNLDLQYGLLAKNTLRPETGAVAAPWELADIRNRIQPRLSDSQSVAENRLDESDLFHGGIVDKMRPGSRQQQQSQLPEWAASSPKDYQDAKQAGFSDAEIMDWFSRNLSKP